MNLKAVFILSIFINPFILLSQEEEKTPLWIEKGETIISIKPGAKIAIKEPQKSIEKIIKYVDVDHGSRKVFYFDDDKKILKEQNFKDIEYIKPLKRGVPYAAKVVTLSGLFGAVLGYYSLSSDNSNESDSESIFQTAFAGGIAGGFIGSYVLSEKRPYISHFVYIEQSGEVVRDFPEVFRFSDNEWRFIE